jgi:hypothetical protein
MQGLRGPNTGFARGLARLAAVDARLAFDWLEQEQVAALMAQGFVFEQGRGALRQPQAAPAPGAGPCAPGGGDRRRPGRLRGGRTPVRTRLGSDAGRAPCRTGARGIGQPGRHLHAAALERRQHPDPPDARRLPVRAALLGDPGRHRQGHRRRPVRRDAAGARCSARRRLARDRGQRLLSARICRMAGSATRGKAARLAGAGRRLAVSPGRLGAAGQRLRSDAGGLRHAPDAPFRRRQRDA